ncbi:unnamed protein product [Schistosoma turkestanicum]|nr:unnamed protein product [Schistosoma turkestanicum]
MRFLPPGSVNIASELHLTKTRRMPSITRPDQVLIKVKAASLNPVDSLLVYGYGSTSFNLLRRFASNYGCFGLPDNATTENANFPFTPGRDFAGEIVDIGSEVASSRSIGKSNNKLSIGTHVAGATWPFLSTTGSGSLAEYIVCPANYVTPLPSNVSFTSAAALAYAGLTAWSALVDCGGINPSSSSSSSSDYSILITGATGGVGFIAAQLAKLWGWKVHVTCPNDKKALDLMNILQIDEIFPHPTKIPTTLKYDLILDCVRPDYLKTSTTSSSSSSSSSSTDGKQCSLLIDHLTPQLPSMLTYLNNSSTHGSHYMMLNPPLLYLTDYWGPFIGSGLAYSQLFYSNLTTTFSSTTTSSSSSNSSIISSNRRNKICWVFFKPNNKALNYLLQLLSNQQLIIPIDTIYQFDQVTDAFNRMYARGVRGKLVIEMNN